ncbi:MAG: DUF1015 domain-containing protein [Deferribacteraceae bacterium]|jgi:uncharacterized protein (DUF1015 family)|nr:DUF1015 domain-containing protein [Deferribacteraceae bacterium]
MAIVKPFKGIRYNLEKVLLKQVIAPPYDVVTPEMRANYVSRSPYNVLNIDLPENEDNKYQHAANLYSEWRKNGIMIKEQQPALYIYEQVYEYASRSYVRTGFVGLLKLEPFENGVVFPHEKTLSGPKQDRFDLMTACKANFSQIFGLYLDPEERLRAIFDDCRNGMPVASATDDDKVKYSIWPIFDPKVIEEIQFIMRDKAIYIADGHHRYETSLMHRDKMREEYKDDENTLKPYDFVMMMFVNFYDPGLIILPTHRVVSFPENYNEERFMAGLSNFFSITKLESLSAGKEFLSKHKEPGTIVMIMKNDFYGLFINQEMLELQHPVYRNIDTFLLQKIILNEQLGIPEEQILMKKGIYFYQFPEDVREHIARNDGIGFILNPSTIDIIRKVSENGLIMPQKSTFFHPKLATGLLINELCK